MPKSSAKTTLSAALKAAVERCGATRYEIAKHTGVPQTSLMRFMRGETSLRLDKADALAEYLGLELVPNRKTK